MSDQVAFSVNIVKEEDCQEGDFVDDKVQMSETVITAEVQDNLIYEEIKQYDISTTLANIKSELSIPEVQNNMIHDSLKIEKGINVDDVKIEFNNGFLYCEDCHVYCEEYCAKCGMLVHILNKTVPISADTVLLKELPNNILEVRNYSGECRICAVRAIPTGVKFGPFTGLNRVELPWKVKGGKFVVDKHKSKHLNWMQYVSPARNVYEKNLLVFQYKHNLYYQTTRHIQQGDELLVYFGEEYEDSLKRNVEMDFIPTVEHVSKDAFTCTFCCFGFSSKSYLVKHKALCPGNADGGFSIEELMQCAKCNIHLDRKEYLMHHMAYCCKINDRKCILPVTGDCTPLVTRRKTQPRQMFKCQQCKYKTKYKGDLDNHANKHYEVKMYKCGICCRRFKTKEVLTLHVEEIHVCDDGKDDLEHSTGAYTKTHVKAEYSRPQSERKQFQCSLCEFRTKYKISLKRHVKVKHLKEFKYKCETCDYKTKWKSQLRIHIDTKHLHEFKYKCDTCDYKTNRKTQLKRHTDTRHLNEFKYKCDICDYKTNFMSNLKIHIETRHLKVFKYKCATCNYKTNVKSNLKIHVERKHLKVFKYKCDTCSYKTNVKSYLKIHIQTRHLKVFKYKCDTCEYKANLKHYIRSHIESKHSSEFNYKCDTCDYKTNRKSQLKIHIDTRHLNEFKYKCDTCDYKTNVKSHLKIHVETRHLKVFKYKCDTCDYKVNQKSKLKSHIEARHLIEFKYKCGTCDYKTNQESDLKSHIEIRHLIQFKYNCDACDYKTNVKSRIDIHAKAKHLKEFKYKCDTCDFKTIQKSKLKSHVETKHLNEYKYNCDTCGYKTNNASHLKRHAKAKHL